MARMRNSSTLWVISEVYYPDEQGGAYFMTQLAAGLSRFFHVHVICGYPSYNYRDIALPGKSKHDNVLITRCIGTRFNKNNFLLRILNILTISLSIFIKSLCKIRMRDIVIVVTTPPLLPFLIALACKLRGSKCILRIEDLYPEAMIATGLINKSSAFARFMVYLNVKLFNNVDIITVLGRDMKALVEKTSKNTRNEVAIIQNWAALDELYPIPKSDNSLLYELGLKDKFVVQCSGNMGLAQNIENIFKAIEMISENGEIHFIFIGSGAKINWMAEEVHKKKLKNVKILSQRPRSDQQNFLNACDVAIVSLIHGMKGAGVPSRLYNIMAVGKPIIAFAECDSELSMVIEEEKIGWSVPSDNYNRLAEVVLKAYSDQSQLLEKGARARAAAVNKYAPSQLIGKYKSVIEKLAK